MQKIWPFLLVLAEGQPVSHYSVFGQCDGGVVQGGGWVMQGGRKTTCLFTRLESLAWSQ